MNNAKHTPGPWTLGRSGEVDYPVFADGRDIANVYGGEVSRDAFLANARLIAAAPDLLEALQLLLECIPESEVDKLVPYGNLVLCENAIAKATGGSK